MAPARLAYEQADLGRQSPDDVREQAALGLEQMWDGFAGALSILAYAPAAPRPEELARLR